MMTQTPEHEEHQMGTKLEAVKEYRSKTGASLKDAIAFVEANPHLCERFSTEKFAEELGGLIAKHKALAGYDLNEMIAEVSTALDVLNEEADDAEEEDEDEPE
jgi:hypothetical protein